MLVDLLSKRLTLASECLDFLLALEELSLVVVFFADSDAHLMLDVAKLKDLFLKLLLYGDKLLGFLIKFTLHLIEIAVKHGDALL